jgi:hypothetical protein
MQDLDPSASTPTHETGRDVLPVVKTRSQARSVLEDTEDADPDRLSGGRSAVGDALNQAEMFVPLNSPLGDSIPEARVPSSILEWRDESSYEPADEGGDESFPEEYRPGLPWTGEPMGLYSDGAVLLAGQAASAAFDWTRQIMVRKARRASSPYRKAGLSKEEAERAEKRRLRTADRTPVTWGVALPVRGDGCRVRRVGIVTRTPNGDGPVIVLKRENGTTVPVDPDRWATVMRFVKAVDPAADRAGRLQLVQRGQGDLNGPLGDASGEIEVHLDKEVRASTLQAERREIERARRRNVVHDMDGRPEQVSYAFAENGPCCPHLGRGPTVPTRNQRTQWPNPMTRLEGFPEHLRTMHGAVLPTKHSVSTGRIPPAYRTPFEESSGGEDEPVNQSPGNDPSPGEAGRSDTADPQAETTGGGRQLALGMPA